MGVKGDHIAMPDVEMVSATAKVKRAPEFVLLFFHSGIGTVGLPVVGNVAFKMQHGAVCHRPDGFAPDAIVFVFTAVLVWQQATPSFVLIGFHSQIIRKHLASAAVLRSEEHTSEL